MLFIIKLNISIKFPLRKKPISLLQLCRSEFILSTENIDHGVANK
jgi:hypothetical protein